MARKTTADAAKDKAAKQKKIVILLGVFLVLAAGYAYKTMSGLSGGASSASKPQAVAAGAVTPPTTGPAASGPAPAAPSLAGNPLAVTPSTPAPTSVPDGTDSSSLIAVVVPTAGTGQLESFSRFASK